MKIAAIYKHHKMLLVKESLIVRPHCSCHHLRHILHLIKGRAISSKNGKNVGNGQSYLPIDFCDYYHYACVNLYEKV